MDESLDRAKPIGRQTRSDFHGQLHGAAIVVGQVPRFAWAFRTMNQVEWPAPSQSDRLRMDAFKPSTRQSSLDRDRAFRVK